MKSKSLQNFPQLPSTVYLILLLLLSIPGSSLVKACLQLTENDRPVLFCQSAIPALPIPKNEIPAKVAKLTISGMNELNQHNGILTRDNLTGLETLTYLQISNFALKEIDTHTFSAMEHLRILDLSKNHIITIRPEAFAGPSLKLLSLTDNKGIRFDKASFHGARVFHLAARNCDLTTVDYETIAEAKPKQLSLSDNKLTWLDPQFAELVIDSSKLKSYHSSGRLSSSSHSPILGYLDLSNNPLNCNCQLVWLSRLSESQSYDAYQYMNSKELTNNNNNNNDLQMDASDWPVSPSESSIRIMQHLNMTCAQPPSLAGKRLPRSWEYFCPLPSITGIEINLLTPSADLAQLTCIGRGRPTPSLAWTYKIHGQKVQQILDASIKQQTFNDQYFLQSVDKSLSLDTAKNNKLIERKLALNVSLNSVNIKNFTCTIWNNDKDPPSSTSLLAADSSSSASLDSITDKLKPTSLIVPTSDSNQPDRLQHYRIHEVTVRVSGPLRSPEFISPGMISGSSAVSNAQPQQQQGSKVENDANSPPTMTTTSQMATNSLQEGKQDSYSYLFIKRFTLLELLGAVVGTFISTLALLYLATNCLSWFCQINNHMSVKSIRKSNLRSNSGKWFSWINHNPNNNNNHNHNNNTNLLLSGGNRQAMMNHNTLSHRSSQNGNGLDAKLLQHADIQETTCTTFADMGLTSSIGSPLASQFSSTTISTRRPNIPQALLLTSVPTPRLEANSTPPPNPAYWPMPEYTYSGGAGSHEYDVPRPLEAFTSERCCLKSAMPENITLNPSTAQSFLNLAAQSLFPMNGGGTQQVNRNDLAGVGGGGGKPNGGIFQTSATIPPLTMQWTQTINPMNNTLTINPVLAWQSNLMNSNNSSSLLTSTPSDKQIHSSNYTNQPSTQSILYTSDYPTYLQTRPYPHHKEQQQQQQQQQQLLEQLMTNSARSYPVENFTTTTPVDILPHDLPRKSDNKIHMNGSES
ncbi:unnamed protein product [Trichobilharzia szidati]|nr:unnamed protein product [Trichobilharzia szidati]CAH8853123.1 unnamed protein product [Trichobilharzia szidati]